MYAILEDPHIKPVPECTADDLDGWLCAIGKDVERVSLAGLSDLDSLKTHVLLVPYLTGEFGDAFENLLTFHKHGGAILFLGDLPHHDCWYPLRNMQAPDLNLTRCNDNLQIQGFSKQAEKLLGNLPIPTPVLNRTVSALRISAYPPDLAYNLLESVPNSDWPIRAVVLVDRKGETFLGSRMGIIGFTGGEPRENAAGVYQREWNYDPGLLTREWTGLPLLIERMTTWMVERKIEGALRCRPVVPCGENDTLSIHAKNCTTHPTAGQLFLESAGKVVWSSHLIKLESGKEFTAKLPLESHFGIETLSLYWQNDATPEIDKLLLHQIRRRILPTNTSEEPGMGFSTYQAFKDGVVTESFRQFVLKLRDCGMQYIRCNIPWEDVEPEPERYDWRIPDQLLTLAEEAGLNLHFWSFPTTRGSGLSDCGVPNWILKEPALDRDGKPGLFPSLGSPYRVPLLRIRP